MVKGLAAASVVAATLSASEAVRVSSHSMVAYEEFCREHDVQREHADEASYLARVALFEQRTKEVIEHNSKPGRSWVAVVNKFADYTPSEFNALLGHRPLGRVEEPSAASLVQLKPGAPLAASVDWVAKLKNSTQPKDQGSCGSCWAVAAAGALETHSEAAHGSTPEVSFEEIVACTPNPEECGGKGGCDGATSELAFQYVKDHGVVAKADYKGYSSGNKKCTQPAASQSVLTTTGFERLPVNKLQPLMAAVAEHGPVVVSVDASKWGAYGGGVFDECGKDAVINHAVLLMGYGTDAKLKKNFWNIRNSWGSSYGEKGFIRLLRHTEEDAYCGTDSKPLDGVGCKGGPATLPVCGMCGVLADSAYPTGVQLASKKLV